jgi:tetratricopeptide (TPR) repeat protein
MPSSTFYAVPESYIPNPALQRAFMQVLLARAEGALGTAVDTAPAYRYPDHAQMWLALTRLEKQVQEGLPDLAERAAGAKEKLFASLNRDLQRQVDGDIVTENAPRKSFDDQVAWAEKQENPAHRDQLLTSAILSSAKEQPVEKVLSVIDKISDPAVREPLVSWFYHFRAQALLEKKEFAEAREAAAKVAELDQRAYLYTRIAEESLKIDENQTIARELLDEVAQAIGKAPKTIVTARALLALAYLYAKVDTNRGIEELGNAVRTINALESPDFSRPFVVMKIEGKTFGSYFSLSTPGFNPENAFREMGKLDFDGSLVQATNLSNKLLRALTTLAVIEPCFSHRSTPIKPPMAKSPDR